MIGGDDVSHGKDVANYVSGKRDVYWGTVACCVAVSHHAPIAGAPSALDFIIL